MPNKCAGLALAALVVLLLPGCPHDFSQDGSDGAVEAVDAGDARAPELGADGPGIQPEAGKPDRGTDKLKPPPREVGPPDRGPDKPGTPTDSGALDKPPLKPDQNKPCGNLVIDTGEQCDGTNLNKQTCVTQKYVGGQLTCGLDCKLVVSGCYKVTSTVGSVLSGSVYGQQSPAIASDGSGYLVVWSEYNLTYGNYFYRIRGQRMKYNGVKVGAAFTLDTSTTIQRRWPSVAYLSGEYLVVWSTMGGTTYQQTWGRRVTKFGVLQGSGPTMITDKGKNPSVAAGGGGFLVVWSNPDPSTSYQQVRAARVALGFNNLDPNGITVSSPNYSNQQNAVAAYTGKDFLVVWEDGRNAATTQVDIYGARVDVTGAVLDKKGIAVNTGTGNQGSPAVASDGKAALVAWRDWRNGAADPALYGSRVSNGGVVLDKAGSQISGTQWNNRAPAVAWGGGAYQVVQPVDKSSGTGNDIRGERLDSAGKLTTGNFLVNHGSSGARYHTAVARGLGRFLVAWTDFRVTQGNIYTTLVTP